MSNRLAALLVGGALAVAAPVVAQPPPAAPLPSPVSSRPRPVQVMSLESPAWADGGLIPAAHTQVGRDVSPPLEWRGAPEGIATFVLVVRDLDAVAPGGGDDLLQSAAGYAGRSVSGTLWVCGGSVGDAVLAACRDAARELPARARAGVTCLPSGITLARCLCDSTEQARGYLSRVWALLRPLYAGRAAAAPRLWAT